MCTTSRLFFARYPRRALYVTFVIPCDSLESRFDDHRQEGHPGVASRANTPAGTGLPPYFNK
jgi:hypothetical protein